MNDRDMLITVTVKVTDSGMYGTNDLWPAVAEGIREELSDFSFRDRETGLKFDWTLTNVI